MKRTIGCVLLAALLVAVFPLNCHAANVDDEMTTVYYFENGSYMTETLQVYQLRASGSVTGNKVRTYYGSDGSTDWKAVLSGTFTYTGSSATCTASSCDVTIYDSAWYVISKSASKSGSSATASVTMGEKLLGITVNEVPISLKLTCDANGNLS